jgi:CBS-domain-containing membrane protein
MKTRDVGVLHMSLLRQGKALAVTIYLGESDQWQGMPLYSAIIRLLRDQGCAGATVTRAIAGYGAGARLHESGALRWSSDASIVIQVIDQPDRLRRLLPRLQEMLNGGLITAQEVEVLKYKHARRRGLPAKLSVRQIMETQVTTVYLDTPVSAIIDALLEAPFRALPVIDEQHHVQGIISTGDLINIGVLPMRRGLLRTALELDESTVGSIEASLAQARQSSLTARDIMNREVCTVRPDQSIREAARVMIETGLRRLPVVEADQTLVGIVTRTDLLQVVVTSPLMSSQASSATQPLRATDALAAHDSIQQRPVSDYLNQDIAVVDEQTSIADVIDALMLSPVKRVVVVDHEQHVRGIISDVDVLARIQEELRPGLLAFLRHWARRTSGNKSAKLTTGALNASSSKTARAQIAADIMNRNVVTITQTASVQETVEKMVATRRKILPVVDLQGHLIGSIGLSDLPF